MAKAIGFGRALHRNGVTEGDLFAALAMATGDKYIVSGALVRDGQLYLVSHAVCNYANLAEVHALQAGRGAVVLEVQAGSGAPFADALSLAW